MKVLILASSSKEKKVESILLSLLIMFESVVFANRFCGKKGYGYPSLFFGVYWKLWVYILLYYLIMHPRPPGRHIGIDG